MVIIWSYVTEEKILSISDDFNEVASYMYKQSIKFPSLCKRVPANCQPFLFPLVNDSVLLLPSDDTIKYYNVDTKFFMNSVYQNVLGIFRQVKVMTNFMPCV